MDGAHEPVVDGLTRRDGEWFEVVGFTRTIVAAPVAHGAVGDEAEVSFPAVAPAAPRIAHSSPPLDVKNDRSQRHACQAARRRPRPPTRVSRSTALTSVNE